MEKQYVKTYSPALHCEMECNIYGHAGKPVLFIPCQDGRFFDFENFNMAATLSPWIDSGQIMVCSIDTIDKETWSDRMGNPRMRICRHEQWITYITNEVVPFLQELAMQKNAWNTAPGILVFGCSLGAMHAANLYLRRPDLFDSLLALSGIYSSEYGFGGYMDDLVYLNSPIHYMPNLPENHPYIEIFNRQKAVICVGLGAWEYPDSTRALDWTLKNKGINIWVDYWGYDSSHDWSWWFKQAEHFLPYLLSF